jgi:RNA polymerase sigma factor (sigma-70 family)
MAHTTTDLAASARRSSGDEARAMRAALYERVLGRIHAYFRKVVFDAGQAEECLSRTLLELERSLDAAPEARGGYDPARSFNAWMWLKAHTVFAQWCREREREGRAEPGPGARVRPRLEPLGDRDPAAPPTDVDRRLDAEAVLREVERRLGRETHEAFVLYYAGDLTQQEIAEMLGRDRGTVARRIAEAHALNDVLLGKNGR